MKRLLVLLCLPVLFCTGCRNKVELEDRDYVLTMGIDLSTTGETSLTLCLGGLGEEDTVLAENLTGADLPTAMAQLETRNHSQAYYGCLRAVVLGPRLLADREALLRCLETLEADPVVNNRLLLTAAQGNAAELVSALPKTTTPYGLYFSEYFRNHPETPDVNLEDALVLLRCDQEPVLPVFGLENGLPKYLPVA